VDPPGGSVQEPVDRLQCPESSGDPYLADYQERAEESTGIGIVLF